MGKDTKERNGDREKRGEKRKKKGFESNIISGRREPEFEEESQNQE